MFHDDDDMEGLIDGLGIGMLFGLIIAIGSIFCEFVADKITDLIYNIQRKREIKRVKKARP